MIRLGVDSFRKALKWVLCTWHSVYLSFLMIIQPVEEKVWLLLYCCVLRKLRDFFLHWILFSHLAAMFNNRQNKPHISVFLVTQPGGRPGCCHYSLCPAIPQSCGLSLFLAIGLKEFQSYVGGQKHPSHTLGRPEGAWTHLLTQVLSPTQMGYSAQEGVSSCSYFACGYYLSGWLSLLSSFLFCIPPSISLMGPYFSPSLLVFIFFLFLFFVFHFPLLPLMVNCWYTLHFFTLLHLLLLLLLLPPPLTSGRGLLYGVCPQPTHSIICLLPSG